MILRQQTANAELKTEPVIRASEILRARKAVREIYLDQKVEEYILNLVFATRFPEKYQLPKLKGLLQYGSSPRGSIYLALAAKAHAFMEHRGFVTPEDVRSICGDVLRHRIGLTYEAEAENITSDSVISEVLQTIPVP
jgi:MoxR-like ATPase